MTAPEKLKMHSPDLTEENIRKIAAMFPGCVTEAAGANGALELKVDFDALRQELSDAIVEGPQERYRLDWPGKRQALVTANTPIAKTLRPCREESVNFDTTKNLFIEGDNLDALKLLQETYLGKIKMIYIDPPYNTGTNLIYRNDFVENTSRFRERSGEMDADGIRLVANTENNGRFHSDWLSMIYPRLKLAKTVLADDGVLVCSIDENEFSTLSKILKEIFGEGKGSYEHSYISIVHNPRGQQGSNFSYVNEYLIFIYPSDKKKYLADFKKDEVDSRGLRDSGSGADRTDAKSCFYPFIVRDDGIIDVGDIPPDSFHPASPNVIRNDGSVEIWPMTDDGDEKKWRYAKDSIPRIREKLRVKMGRKSLQIIFDKDVGTMRSVWANARYDSSEYGTKLVGELVPDSGFTYPKSLWAVYDCIFAATAEDKDAIIMDFFAGSGTTMHATFQLNKDDGGNRRAIAVQFPEAVEPKSASDGISKKAMQKAVKFLDSLGFPPTIAEISKERIRRAGQKILEGECHPDWNKDVGFRVLKVDTSNMADVHYTADETTQDDLLTRVENVKPDRSPEDLLFQELVDWGVDLTLPIRRETIDCGAGGGKTVFFVADNALLACFDTGVTEALVSELAGHKPLRIVFRNTGFDSDATLNNVTQIFKQLSPDTEVRVI